MAPVDAGDARADVRLLAIATSWLSGVETLQQQMWGGATVRTAIAVRAGDPWKAPRLIDCARASNILFRCCFARRNAVGYTTIRQRRARLHKRSGRRRRRGSVSFASLHATDNPSPCRLEAVRRHEGALEAAICYTGNILDPPPEVRWITPSMRERDGGAGPARAVHKDNGGVWHATPRSRSWKGCARKSACRSIFTRHDTSGNRGASVSRGRRRDVEIADACGCILSGAPASVYQLARRGAAPDRTRYGARPGAGARRASAATGRPEGAVHP